MENLIILILAVAILIAIIDKARTWKIVKTLTHTDQHLTSMNVDLLTINDNILERLDALDGRGT